MFAAKGDKVAIVIAREVIRRVTNPLKVYSTMNHDKICNCPSL